MLHAIHGLLPLSLFCDCPAHTSDKQTIPFGEVNSLDDLAYQLTSAHTSLDQWVEWKNEIRTFLGKHSDDPKKLDEFLTTVTQWGMEKDPQKMMAVMVEIIGLDVLTNVVRFKGDDPEMPFDNVFDWAAEHAPLYPESTESSLQDHFFNEWNRNRPFIFYVIPNLVNIFLGAFNFLDTHKKYTTIWEKHLLLEIIYKFFVIPYFLVQILQPHFKETAKVYFVAALIIFSVGVLISCYQRWFRPIPDEIVNSDNLDKQMLRGWIEPKVGQTKEVGLLIRALEADSNVLLVGLSGEGKTALLHHLINLKHQGQLSEKLQKLSFYEVDCGLLISNVSFGHAELITQMKNQVEGYEDFTLLFFDDFNQIVTNKAAFCAFKKRFLNDKPNTRFVAAITNREFEEMAKLDIDESFRRQVVTINVKSSSDRQNTLILRKWINRNVKDIPVTDDAIEAILELSNSESFLPNVGRPAKVIRIMEYAIGKCRASFNPHFITPELSEAREKYEALKLQAEYEVKVPPSLLKEIYEHRQEILLQETELREEKSKVRKIKKCMDVQQKLNDVYFNATHLISQAADSPQIGDVLDEDNPELENHYMKRVNFL